jgi:polyisoprenoid-binding protein YceI
MPTHDASTATCHVFTFKEGVLSAVAHDLRLRVERFTIDIDEAAGSVRARLFADSLRVDCAMKAGRDDPDALSDRNRREIEGNIVDDVLHARRHPQIVFRSTEVEGEGDERRITGTLALHGTERPLAVTARRHAGRWTAEVELRQPDFGIKPYSAMLGALRIQPTVRVRVSVPA